MLSALWSAGLGLAVLILTVWLARLNAKGHKGGPMGLFTVAEVSDTRDEASESAVPGSAGASPA